VRGPARVSGGWRAASATALALLVLLDGCAPGPRPRPAGELVAADGAVVEPGPSWPELGEITSPAGEPEYPDTPGPEWPDLEAVLPPRPEAARPAPPLVRIGLADGVPRATLACSGGAWLLDGDGATRLARLDDGARAELFPAGRGVRWQAGGIAGNADAVILQADGAADVVAWGKARYRGALVVRGRPGGLLMINAVDLEQYLRGVVPGEIGRLGPEAAAALEAQAIAARTYTVFHRGQHADLGFDLWGDIRDQLYEGLAGEDATCDAAIARTAGLVLRYGDREIEAYYSSTCGGRTAACAEVWPRDARPYLLGRRDAPRDGASSFCAAAPRFAWREQWSVGDLERILQRTLPEYVNDMGDTRRATWAGVVFTPRAGGAGPSRPGRLLGLAVRARTTCGRVAQLDVTTDAGVYHVRGDRVRSALRLSGNRGALWSALFRLHIETGRDGRPRRIAAYGRGFGHGVGMCQTGAIGMSRRGFKAGQILAHYYPGAELALLPAITPDTASGATRP